MKICTKKPTYDIEKWIKHYLSYLQKEEELSENTLSLYTRLLGQLRDYIEELEGRGEIKSIKEIDARFIASFLHEMEERRAREIGDPSFGYSHATRSLYIVVLKTLFDYIEDHAQLEDDGTRFTFAYEFKELTKRKRGRKTKRARAVKHLTSDEVDNLVHYLDLMAENRQRHYDYIYALAIKLMLFAGLRVSETLSLTIDDISTFLSRQGDEIVELTLRNTKSGIEQYVPIKRSHIERELEYTLNLPNREDDYLICNKKGRNTISRENLYRVVKRIMSEAGVEKKGLHILRHTAAMMLLDRSGDITFVQELLRHSNIATTMIYVKRSTRQLGERVV